MSVWRLLSTQSLMNIVHAKHVLQLKYTLQYYILIGYLLINFLVLIIAEV